MRQPWEQQLLTQKLRLPPLRQMTQLSSQLKQQLLPQKQMMQQLLQRKLLLI
jgi:hypothetical protein